MSEETLTLEEWKQRAQDAEKRLAEFTQSAGSDHGAPDLTEHDIWLLKAHSLWVQTATEAQKIRPRGIPEHWLPHYPDWIKSRLFWRIRSGKEPLKYPPPTCYSCPWYEVVEMPDIVHSTAEEVRVWANETVGKYAVVAQCRYEIISGPDDPSKENPLHLRYGKYRFKAWNGLVEWKGVHKNGEPYSNWHPGGFIQFDGEEPA